MPTTAQSQSLPSKAAQSDATGGQSFHDLLQGSSAHEPQSGKASGKDRSGSQRHEDEDTSKTSRSKAVVENASTTVPSTPTQVAPAMTSPWVVPSGAVFTGDAQDGVSADSGMTVAGAESGSSGMAQAVQSSVDLQGSGAGVAIDIAGEGKDVTALADSSSDAPRPAEEGTIALPAKNVLQATLPTSNAEPLTTAFSDLPRVPGVMRQDTNPVNLGGSPASQIADTAKHGNHESSISTKATAGKPKLTTPTATMSSGTSSDVEPQRSGSAEVNTPAVAPSQGAVSSSPTASSAPGTLLTLTSSGFAGTPTSFSSTGVGIDTDAGQAGDAGLQEVSTGGKAKGKGIADAGSNEAVLTPSPFSGALTSISAIAGKIPLNAASGWGGSGSALTQGAATLKEVTDHAQSAVSSSPEQPGVTTARLLQSFSRSEMQVNVSSPEFGRVTIHTAYGREAISAQVTLENTQLGSALAAHVPAMEQKLGQDHGLRASVTINTQTQSETGGGSGRGTDAQSQRRPSATTSTTADLAAGSPLSSVAIPVPALAGPLTQSRLDIRI